MNRTRVSQLALWGAVGLVVGIGLHTLLERTGAALPQVPWPAIVGMLGLSVVLFLLGWPVRQWRDGDRETEIDPVRAARVAMLAKAAALAGSVLTGWYAGAAVYLFVSASGLRAAEGLGMLAAVGAAAVLMATGLLVESFCSLPPGGPRSGGSRDSPGRRGPRTDPPEVPA
ncbi:DUF3180 domain-containing protein [Brevibacterium album]|uniref:DUF3180 domain-containing protein n=1 Tax=Brevibacterium album TaxID=417948 RepID=UPI000424D383|nr:DUF3180 domain-containing protein [Brevibacterium album]